jgi:hypothetical protein
MRGEPGEGCGRKNITFEQKLNFGQKKIIMKYKA